MSVFIINSIIWKAMKQLLPVLLKFCLQRAYTGLLAV